MIGITGRKPVNRASAMMFSSGCTSGLETCVNGNTIKEMNAWRESIRQKSMKAPEQVNTKNRQKCSSTKKQVSEKKKMHSQKKKGPLPLNLKEVPKDAPYKTIYFPEITGGIFSSHRNLAIHLMASLAGVPITRVAFGQSHVVTALGAFSHVAVYADDNCIDEFNTAAEYEDGYAEFLQSWKDWGPEKDGSWMLMAYCGFFIGQSGPSDTNVGVLTWNIHLSIDTEAIVKGEADHAVYIQCLDVKEEFMKLLCPQGCHVESWKDDVWPTACNILPPNEKLDKIFQIVDEKRRMAALVKFILKFAGDVSAVMGWQGWTKPTVPHYVPLWNDVPAAYAREF